MTKLEKILEDMIDSNDLQTVLATLVEICRGKAEHLRDNWQDNTASKAWDHAARKIDQAHDRIVDL